MREKLEKQADQLGIPFTHETSDEDLQMMIAARTGQEPPTTPEMTELPPCYGVGWAVTEEPECQACEMAQKCLMKLVTETIPSLRAQLGREVTPEDIENEWGIPSVSARLALSWRAGQSMSDVLSAVQPLAPPPPVVQEVVQTPPPPLAPPAPVMAATNQEEAMVAKKKKAPKSPKAKAKTATESAVAGDPQNPQSAVSALPAAETAKAPAGVSATPATGPASAQMGSPSLNGKGRKVAPKSKPKKSSSISTKQSAKKSPAKKVAPKQPSKKLDPKPEGAEPWGEHTFLSRWERERARSKPIAAIKPGSKLVREFNAVLYTALCRQGFYLLSGIATDDKPAKKAYLPENEKFPTLGAMTLKITGGKDYPVNQDGKPVKGKTRHMTNWSGPRFWKLSVQ
jgi:hypothetical protein